MTATKTRRIVDRSALAAYLGTTDRHVRNMVEHRRIPFVRVGRLIRFDLDDIDGWLDAHKTDAVAS